MSNPEYRGARKQPPASPGTTARRISPAAWFGLCALAAIALAWLASTAIRHHLLRQINAELVALRADGFAVTLPEAAAKYGHPPPGQVNAADWWWVLGEQRSPSKDLGDPMIVPFVGLGADLPLGAPMSNEVKSATADYLETQAPYLACMEQALVIENCHLAYLLTDYWQLGYSEASAALYGSRLLRLRAALSARTGGLDKALADIESGLAIGECFKDEPIELLQFIAIISDSIALDALQDALHFGAPDEVWLHRVQRRLLAKAESVSPQLAVETSLAGGLKWFDAPDMELFGLGHYAVFDMDARWMRDSWLTTVAIGANHLLLALAPYREADRLALVQTRAELLRLMREPMDSWWPDAKAWEARVPSLPGSRVFTKLVHRFEWASPPRQFLRHRARLRSAATALAALRYRMYCGVPPPDLQALVPEWLDVVPTDPFNGMPLQYRADASGLRVYSIGANDIDDGGRTTAGPAADEPLDEGFCVAVPAVPEAE
jgi:hypothetical protein